jgi:pSer/pThr/pTyr-binding forkhead associated (FHA) protein
MSGEEFTIGRSPDSDIPAIKDISISRKHAVVKVKVDEGHPRGSRIVVEDLGSSFGTYVGEKALESSATNSQVDRIDKKRPVNVEDGDRIRFGLHSTVYRFARHEFLSLTCVLIRLS